MSIENIKIVFDLIGIGFLVIVMCQAIIAILEILFYERDFYMGLCRVFFPFMSYSYPPIMRRLVQYVHDKADYHYMILPGDNPRITRKNMM